MSTSVLNAVQSAVASSTTKPVATVGVPVAATSSAAAATTTSTTTTVLSTALAIHTVPNLYWCGTPWVEFSWTGGTAPYSV